MQSGNQIEQRVGCPPLRDAIIHHVRYSLVRRWKRATPREKLFAVSLAVRDRLIDNAVATFDAIDEKNAKCAFYLSMEFLMGKSLENALINLGLLEECRQVLRDELGTDLNDLIQLEQDAALGNGGLGRLAACFLDSIATLGLPGIGYGINYDFGLFRQEFTDNEQVERPDEWRAHGTPWLIERQDEAYEIPTFGRVIEEVDDDGNYVPQWVDCETILGVPFDMPIPGYNARAVTALRLFAARANRNFDMQIFNEGDYMKAVERKVTSETVSKVLYPSEQPEWGPTLRLLQEYFLVACSLKDIFKKFVGDDPRQIASKAAIQLNDTHPALTVAELMRVLVDEHRLPWDEAWEITTQTCSYTNHTLLPEALERWPLSLVEEMLPRHLQIIYEINRQFLDKVGEQWPEDGERAIRMSIIEEGEAQQVRMANLAIVGSHAVNGVAAVHSELVKSHLVPDFYALWPDKFQNKTNGVTPRRWIVQANPGMTALINEAIGDEWITDLGKMRALEPMAEDAAFRERFMAAKTDNKRRLSSFAERNCGRTLNPNSIVDTQIKRIHEYKRQLMNALHIIYEYLRIAEDGYEPQTPRTFVFGGKAAPGYWTAKQIIHLILSIGDAIDRHPLASEYLKVIYLQDYDVSHAESIIPATDLSEQISTAGFEASGTGNMKFAMNGALTIGTMDGANIEIAEEVGADNLFIFGNTVEQVHELDARQAHPMQFYENNEQLRRVMDVFHTDLFSPGEHGKFSWVFNKLVEKYDRYYHLADLAGYIDAHQRATDTYGNREEWARRSILNVARMGKFSSDRTIAEYAKDIWGIEPIA
jgi:glycogen phosphorylase